MLVNANKLIPYKYMESKVQKKEQQMLVYWEQNACGVQEANYRTKEDDEGCATQKPQMKNVEDKEQITHPTVNTIFIFDLQMNNSYKSAGFGMQRSKDDMLSVSAESTIVFAQSLRTFAQSSKLWAQLLEIFVLSIE